MEPFSPAMVRAAERAEDESLAREKYLRMTTGEGHIPLQAPAEVQGPFFGEGLGDEEGAQRRPSVTSRITSAVRATQDIPFSSILTLLAASLAVASSGSRNALKEVSSIPLIASVMEAWTDTWWSGVEKVEGITRPAFKTVRSSVEQVMDRISASLHFPRSRFGKGKGHPFPSDLSDEGLHDAHKVVPLYRTDEEVREDEERERMKASGSEGGGGGSFIHRVKQRVLPKGKREGGEGGPAAAATASSSKEGEAHREGGTQPKSPMRIPAEPRIDPAHAALQGTTATTSAQGE